MKLAIPLYGNRVCPRFGYTQEIMIVELDGKSERDRHTFRVGHCLPEHIPEILRKKGVSLVISGGMNHFFQNLFRSRGIEVLWGIIGEAEDVLSAFVAGRLRPGMGSCPGRRRRKRFRGGGRPP
jgi:predicted Fe-Mo cluster-binding NifX family protein